MKSVRAGPKQNYLLAALPSVVYTRLLPLLQSRIFSVGEILIPANFKQRYVYFPTTCIALLSYGVGATATPRTWPVGREGIVGITAFLGESTADSQAEIQVAGEAFQLDAKLFRTEFKLGGGLQLLLLRYVEILITQASQLVICEHSHTIDQRLCRFLLRAFDRVPSNSIETTHARIASLMGVRRVSVTAAAGRLQSDGVIDYSRGRITLLNRPALEHQSCDCYVIIKKAFEGLRLKSKVKSRSEATKLK